MDMTSSSQNGGDSAVFDPASQPSSSYTSAPSFGPSLHQQRITHHDQSRSYVPKVVVSAQNSMSHNKVQQPTADSHFELITNLKIRIAVLENELAHATKEKDETIRSSVMIARALGNVANNPELAVKKLRDSDTEELGELRSEVKRLRRENGVLWSRIESREDDHMTAYEKSVNTGPRNEKTYQVPDEGSGRTRAVNPTIEAAIKKISARDEPKHSQHPVDSNEETQLPNTHNLKRLEDGSLEVPSRLPVLPSIPKRRRIDDFNNSNLDDALRSDDDEEPEIQIEDQLLYQEQANANFINAPAPAVLKAGFEFSPAKAIRGEDYANRGYANRSNYYARFSNRNAPTGSRSFDFPPNMSEGTSIWATPQQRDDEINNHMRACDSRDFKFPDYFRYGLIYNPKEGEQNTLRGVHIGGLTKDIELRDVLARVRGGRIFSSVLVNTMALSGSNSALVTFINQADAEAYVKYASDHPITFGFSESDEENVIKAIVTHIHTPTFPFSPGKLKTIFELNRTRILTVRNFPQNLSLGRLESDLSGRNGTRADRMLEWYMDEEGTLRMEFSNIDAAGIAFRILSNMNGYREFRLELQFEKDNCEGELEELEKKAEKRKPMFPRTDPVKKHAMLRVGAFGDAEMVGESKDTVDSDLNMQRKRLAALQKHHDAIPSLRGEGLKSSSWADEVIEESGDNKPVGALGRQTVEITALKNNKVSEEKDTLRPQPHQTHSNTTSESTLVRPSDEAPRKDEDTSTNPVTPQRVPRIMTGKQWLLELAAKEPSSSASTSTPTIKNPPAPSPSTPNSNEATPRPRLTLSTTSLPPKITRKSPEPSSAEYSLHSFASSAVSIGDGSPRFAIPKEQFPVQHPTEVQALASGQTIPTDSMLPSFAAPLSSAAGHPDQPSQPAQPIQPIQPIQSTISTPRIQALNTFRTALKNADTNVYFVPGADTEKAILDSEVSSQKGGDREHHETAGKILKEVNEVLSKGGDENANTFIAKNDAKGKNAEPGNINSEEKLATKMNPDEIDLGVDSDTNTDVGGDENHGLFQKELNPRAKVKMEVHTSVPVSLVDGKDIVDSKSDIKDEEVRGRKMADRFITSTLTEAK